MEQNETSKIKNAISNASGVAIEAEEDEEKKRKNMILSLKENIEFLFKHSVLKNENAKERT